MAKGNSPRNGTDSSVNLGFKAKLWLSASSRNAVEASEGNRSSNMDAAEPSRARQPECSGDSPAYAVSKRTGQTASSSAKGERGGANQFASAVRKNGGQSYTPSCVERLLVETLAPYKGRTYDPACGSGGMFVQSEKFIESHGCQLGDISIYGQESNSTTRRLAVMNLALRGIETDFGPENADTFRRDLRADYVLANPPFNDSDWFRKDSDVRRQFGVPSKGQRQLRLGAALIHHIAPHGMAGFVLANGSMSSNQSGDCPREAPSPRRSTNAQSLGRQRDIRQKLIEADLVDCMVALPESANSGDKLFAPCNVAATHRLAA